MLGFSQSEINELEDRFEREPEGYRVTLEISTGDGSTLPDPHRFVATMLPYNVSAKDTMNFIQTLAFGISLAEQECKECMREAVDKNSMLDVEAYIPDMVRYELLSNVLGAAIEYMETRGGSD